ncbi:MAG: ABC-type transport auxiliary lipoprotein family protein [Lautropia sp.]|nr:ABC-type transport auxiliary lipoprotein family protein [Lautropia sp.]
MRKIWVLGAGLWLAGCAGQAPMHFYSLYDPDAVMQAPETMVQAEQPAQTSRKAVEGPAVTATSAAALPDLRFELGQVSVPERLNRSNIVLHPARAAMLPSGGVSSASAQAAARAASSVRASEARQDGRGQAPEAAVSLQILENHRLDAVFGDAFRDALATQLAVLGAAPTGMAAPGPSALLRLDVTVYRFDGTKDGRLDALVDWRVRRLGDASDREYAGLGCRFSHALQALPDHVPSLVTGMQQQIGWLAQQIVDSSRQWLVSGGERRCRSVPVAPAGSRVPERPSGVSRS